MTDLGRHPGPPPQPPKPPSGSAGVPFTRWVHLELRKSVDTLAGFWLLVVIAVLLIMIEGFFLLVGLTSDDAGLSFTIFTQPMAYVLQPLVATLTIMLVTSEWGQRTAMVTFALEPRRTRVLLAKLVAAFTLTLALILILFVVATVCSALLEAVSGNGFEWDLGPGDVVGLVLFEAIAVLIGFGLATSILNTPGAIGAFPVIAYAIPSGLGLVGLFWEDFGTVGRFLNLQSSTNPVLTWSVDSGQDWGRLVVVLLVWAAVPLVLGQVRVQRAEVK
ncbi:ABC transporter permease subunit [Nocardioides sp. 1609]|uniref:ABC transporter permease subunit n=1 Tax=Nocardioides sp. 1609 TaxID=2508327 RepID=UPI0010703D98|nr:ABC transporter permease subunit [Nocardioides sp. 1609]